MPHSLRSPRLSLRRQKMTKVMNIISDTNIGGAGRVLINYMKYYDSEKYELSVVMPKGSKLKEPLTALGAVIYEVDGIGDRSISREGVKELKKVIKRANPDIVHTHGALSGRIAGRQCGKKVIYTRHSAFPVPTYLKKGPGRWLNKLVNEHYADRIIAISNAAAQNLTDSGISPDLIDTMMNGVEPVARVTGKELAAARRLCRVADGEFVLGILARIEDYKGHMDILSAVKRLSDEGRKVVLVIAGTGSYEGEVWAKAQMLGLQNVVFLGFVEDVAPVLSVLDLQLNASWGTETSSLSILEGFSMGLPAIVSDYGGNPSLVDDGVNGYIFPVHDDAALADRIRELMDSPEKLKKMGEEARKIYLERFTGESFARSIENVYEKVLR